MAVVAEYQFGNTKVLIYDDAFKTPEELEKVHQRISNIVLRYMSKKNEESGMNTECGQPSQSHMQE